MSQDDLARHAELGQRGLLEGVRIKARVANEVKRHVYQCSRQILRRLEALLNGTNIIELKPVDAAGKTSAAATATVQLQL